MTRVTRAEVERIAALARVELDPGSLAALTADIARILEYVGRLSAIAPASETGERPWSPEEPSARSRPDEVVPFPGPRPLTDGAPVLADGLFIVPRVEGLHPE